MGLLTKIIDGLHWVNEKISHLSKFLTIVLVGVITVDIFVGVFSRYVLNDAIAWYEESAKYLMLWMVFVASPLVLMQGGHISLDILTKHLPIRLQRLNSVFIYSLLIFFLFILTREGWGLASNASVQQPTSIDISFFWVYLSIPVGGLIMGLITTEFWFRSLRGVIHPTDHDLPNQQLSAEMLGGQ